LHFYGIDRERVCFRLVDVVRTDREKNNRFVENKMWPELREELSAQFHRSILEHGIDQAEKAVSEDEADVVFFACTLFGGKLGPVAEALDVPVLDPVITMLKATEMSVKSKLLCGHETGAGVV
jgi:Asp/Glu/hydantoin racemase